MESSRLLKAKEEGMDALRGEIMRGLEDIEQGRFTAYTTDAELEAFSDLTRRPTDIKGAP